MIVLETVLKKRNQLLTEEMKRKEINTKRVQFANQSRSLLRQLELAKRFNAKVIALFDFKQSEHTQHD